MKKSSEQIVNIPSIDYLRKNLYEIKDWYETVCFGSIVEGTFRPESDIDIAVITRNHDKDSNFKILLNLYEKYGSKFDFKIFELLPIYVQISIIQDHWIIFGDPLEISEYFYFYRKKWEDCKHRILSNQFSSYRERLAIINSRKIKNK
ncbi:MAG: nucleotidyltransferase domain-containing protein [Candidatus Lokiarchaeota archaeon]|nr:nucleotidyltransferase domain-containing protein [Candidatus Harpocratesius repetitus]